METLLWISIGLVAFSYLGYPLVLAVWEGASEVLSGLAFLSGSRERRGRRPEASWPKVSLVLSAFDEEEVIEQKIRNCLALDYPPERLEILVGCDGCTDRTALLARHAGGARVTVHELSPRAGKASVLTRLVPAAAGEIVVLTDANTMLDPGAVKALVRRFRDPAVGAVVGRLRLYNARKKEFEESLYWQYETALKHWEGKRGCVVGANGGIYAVRRLLFSPLRADTIVDDFVIPARVAVRGWKVLFAADAVAHEETTEDVGREFVRRSRIGAGNWQSITRVPDLLDPRTGFLFFAFVSHKLLRWATPFLLAAALVANLVLATDSWTFSLLLLAQMGFYGLAAAGWMGASGPLRRAGSAARYFVWMNAALAVGFWRFLRGTQRATWQRTARTAEATRAA